MIEKIFTLAIGITVHVVIIVGLYYTVLNVLLYHGCV